MYYTYAYQQHNLKSRSIKNMKKMTADALKNKLDQGTILLIDVREPSEYQAEHIEKAHLIPLASLSAATLPSTAYPIVCHCKTGKRSEEACTKLIAENPSLEVCSLEGGIKGWKAAGFPVQSSQNPDNSENAKTIYNLETKIPLDRQVLLGAGLLVVLGALFGLIMHPVFWVLSLVVGGALIYAGFTGWNGISEWLAKMPWNK